MTQVRVYTRKMVYTTTIECSVERVKDGVRLTCDMPHGVTSLLDPEMPQLDTVAVDDDQGRFVGRVRSIRLEHALNRMVIEAVDLSEHARQCIEWPEPEL